MLHDAHDRASRIVSDWEGARPFLDGGVKGDLANVWEHHEVQEHLVSMNEQSLHLANVLEYLRSHHFSPNAKRCLECVHRIHALMTNREAKKSWLESVDEAVENIKSSHHSLQSGMPRSPSRRNFFKAAGAAAAVGIAGAAGVSLLKQPIPSKSSPVEGTIKHKEPEQAFVGMYATIRPPQLRYVRNAVELDFSALKFADRGTSEGKLQRVLRWENITRAADKRFGVPSEYLLAMMCQESYGEPALPNMIRAKNRRTGEIEIMSDGGAGLLHMQPRLASLYGLRLISPSTELVDKAHGKLLLEAIEKTGGDVRKLVGFDDRFHPVLNIDAAARMLCDSYCKIELLASKEGKPLTVEEKWFRAIEEYCGPRNAPRYMGNFVAYLSYLREEKYYAFAKADFEKRNPLAPIGGEDSKPKPPFTFEWYILWAQKTNGNFELERYKREKRYNVFEVAASLIPSRPA